MVLCKENTIMRNTNNNSEISSFTTYLIQTKYEMKKVLFHLKPYFLTVLARTHDQDNLGHKTAAL